MKRVLARIEGNPKGATVIITGAIHGNEGAGIEGLKRIIANIDRRNAKLNGNLLLLVGNMEAYKKGVRFIRQDLNRIWTRNASEKIEKREVIAYNSEFEQREQAELYTLIQEAFERYSGPFIFADLHSVSSETDPFITINDMLKNRRLASKIPVPIILGIEEYIQGSFLNQVNSLGHVAIGFEAGTHDDPKTIDNHAAFVELLLHHCHLLPLSFRKRKQRTSQLKSHLSSRFFEIRFRHEIGDDDRFQMEPNFINFAKIQRQTMLARVNDVPVYSPFAGRLFMPLYQKLGSDGFFIARRILAIALWASEILRQIPWTGFLIVLPGVTRDAKTPKWIWANRRTARFLTIPIFHLLGYRCREQTEEMLCFVRREVKPHL